MPPEPRYITLSEPANEAQPRHIAYYEFGDPSNPNVILCSHGLSRNGLDFERLAIRLAPRYRVLCPDMAGRGYSDWLIRKSDYSYTTYFNDTLALLTHLNIAQVDWIGTSMGGILGMMLASAQPGRIKRMVLNDVGKIVSAAGLKRIMGYVGVSGNFANREEANAALRKNAATFGVKSEEDWAFMFNTTYKALSDGQYALRYDPDISIPFRESAVKDEEIKDIDLSPFWNAVTCPVLILRGGNSDILSRETAQAMRSEKNNVTLTEVEGVGHAPALIDDFQIKTVTDWLDIKTQY
ncbi:MAG TPA: alpha/beta hydrolase [Rickettsiales bacterium]|nr:alpha/beta hydrolase [Rickettsiales bacterium]